MTSNGISLNILPRIHYIPLEKLDYNINEILLEAEFIQKIIKKDKETLSIICKPDYLRQIVGILSTNPSLIEDKSEHFRLLQIIGELFTMKDNKEILYAFLGENICKNSDIFLGTDYRLTTEQFGSETKLDNSEIDESLHFKQEKLITPNSPMRTSINCQQFNDFSPLQTQQYFYNSDNVFTDFLDLLKVQGMDEPCVQHYFSQIFSALLSFKPKTIQSQVLEKHENEYLLNYAYRYIGDFDIADFIEKVCFQLYQPSENISLHYLNDCEGQIIKIINELLDLVTLEIDEFDLQSVCRILKNCLNKCTSHHYSHIFIKFSNIMFTPKRVQNYINILLNSKSSLAICEMSKLIITALNLIQHPQSDTSEAEPKINNSSQFQVQFDKQWLEVVVNNLRRIKENRLNIVDRQRTIMTQFEQTIQIFGEDKLCVIDLIFELVKLNDPFVVNEIIMHDYPQKIFSYLFEYDWNNLLHEKVYQMIHFLVRSVLDSLKGQERQFSAHKDPNYTLLMHLVTHVEVYKQIRKSSSDDTVTLNVKKIQMKRPNMAFVIKIAESLENLRNNFPEINETFENIQRKKWVDFCQTFLKKNLDLQKVNLGEYDQQKDILQSNNFNEGKPVKQSKTSSKLSERFRKNSGKDMSLFILNPSNKKFSTNSIDTSQKNDKSIDTSTSSAQSIQSARIQRKKIMLEEEENEIQECNLSSSRKKVSISVERKNASSIQQGNQNFQLSVCTIMNNIQEKENDAKLIQQNETQANQLNIIRKQSDILDQFDDSWETSTKRIITLGSSNSGGISFDEAQIQKNKLSKQVSISHKSIPKNDGNEKDFIMLKKKSENNQTQVSSFGEKLMENLNIKKKKFSYDEQNSNQFLLSPRIFHKRKRVKSQPNLHSLSCFEGEDELKEEIDEIATFHKENQNKLDKEQTFSKLLQDDISNEKERFQTIKIQPSCSIETISTNLDQSPIKSPIILQNCASISPSKKINRSQYLKQSNSLKENYIWDEKKENASDESFVRLLSQNKNTHKINLTQKIKSQSKSIRPSINSIEQNSYISKINEEDNDSQSENEMSNPKSPNPNSKSDSKN